MIRKIESGMKEKMLKTVRKRKHLLLFLMIFLILFGGFVVRGPTLANDDQQEPLDQEPLKSNEITVKPNQGNDEEQDGSEEDEEEDGEEDEDEKEEGDEDEKEEGDEDEDDDGVDDDDEEKLSREIQVDLDDDAVEIESTLRTGERKDEFKVEIKGDDDFRIKYEYESEVGKEESDIDLEIRFTQLLEYIDASSNGFDETDIIGEPHPLEDFTFTLNSLGVSDTGERLYEINATSRDEVLKVRVLVPEDFTLINGVQIAPTTLKIDIEILEFPYTMGTSQLALKTKVELETSASIGYMEDIGKLEGISTTIGEYTIEFTWASNATVDTIPNIPVEAKIFESEFEYESDDEDAESEIELKLYILYPRGTHIIHDPRIGTPLSTLPYAQGVQIAVPKPIIIIEKLEDIIPHIPIELLFIGSLMATLVVVVVSVPMFLRRKMN